MKTITNAFISGDINSGLAVFEYENAIYEFEYEGQTCHLKEEIVKDQADRKVVNFVFELENPSRFRLDLFIPEECKNAHIGLNGRELISFFDKDYEVKDPEPLIKGGCNDPHKVSTLHPGEVQALNFKWENGDVITLAYYF
ncbi:MAG: hypothetical protein K6G47_12310 [Clostridia bacterium]|nr:hypothetical protein [Clostridia bacterium]